jgi:hypothetical protein
MQEGEELEKAVIFFKIWDHRKVLKDALVGEYEVNVQSIY